MRRFSTREGTLLKEQPYPLNKFPASVIEAICSRIVYLQAVGQTDMSGNQFSRMFADSISAQYRESPVGIVDVSWQSCCW